MSAVSEEIVTTIKNLQNLQSLSTFALGGGTNLAIRFKHRESHDIDLFTSEIIGKSGFTKIKNEIESYFKDKLISFDFPCNINDQYIFARCFISCNDTVIKVELLQNMKILHDIEIIDEIRFISKIDIGLFKLVTASNRSAKKDIYDLDYISDEIPLINLFEELRKKVEKFNHESDKTIFDLDEEKSPINNPELLLNFENKFKQNQSRPIHTDDFIFKLDGKSWLSARYSWRTKVRALFRYLDLDFPRSNPIDI